MEARVMEILDNSGWYEGRKIDVDYMLEDLEGRGFKITNPRIVDLLKEFWNLILEFETPTKDKVSNIRLNIDAGSDYLKEEFKKLSELLQEDLIPVGSIHEESALLLVSNSEKFYMMGEGRFYQISTSFQEMLSVIINEKDVLRIV